MSRKDRSRIDSRSLQKILLIRFRRIGDVILTTPAVKALKQALPWARLVYVIEEPYRKLVEGNPDLDEVIVAGKKPSRREFMALVRRIRRERFDAVLDFHGGPRASLLTWLSGARHKIGYDIAYRNVFYDVRIARRPAEGRLHSVENHVNLVRALDIDVPEIPPLGLPDAGPEEKARLGSLLEKCRAAESRDLPKKSAKTDLVVLHIGAGNRFRTWGTENLTALVRLLDGIPGARTVLIGGEEDKRAEAEILTGAPRTFSLVGRIDLAGVRELLARTALFIGPDSGPMHMAVASGIPVAAWFGPTLPANFGPWKPAADVRIIEKSLDCRPCRQRSCVHGDFRCLQTITPQDVFAACRNLLASRPSAE